jgi:hypothetical protein
MVWTVYTVCKPRGAQILKKKTRSHLKIADGERMTCSKFCTENLQMLGATVQNVVARATWRLKFVHLWCKPYKENSAAGWGETKFFFTQWQPLLKHAILQ